MKCNEVKKLIDKSFIEELDSSEKSLVEKHLTLCQECSKEYQALNNVQGLIAQHCFQNEKIPERFDSELHMKLVAHVQNQEQKDSGRFWWMKLVFTLSFLIVVSTAVFLPESDDVENGGELVSRTTLDSGEPVTIYLTYHSEKPIENASVSIRLDDGVRFYTDREELASLRSHTWRGSFKKGENKIPFVVTSEHEGAFSVYSTARYNGYIHDHRIELHVGTDQTVVAYYSLGKKGVDESL